VENIYIYIYIYKEFLQLIRKKRQFKNGQENWIDTCAKKIQIGHLINGFVTCSFGLSAVKNN
jgi:hypothetical protein